MIEIARERTIPAPAARVWNVVARAERLPEWYARAGSVEVLEGSGLGRRQRLRSQWQGQDSEVDQLVTAFDPEHLLEWRHEAERLGGQPAPRFATETIVRIKLQAQGPDATEVVLESRQQPADPEKEQSMRANSEYLGKMLETSLERLERLVTSESEQAAPDTQGVTVELLATVDLGPEIDGMAGRQLRMRMVTFEPGGVFGPIHDHKGRPGTVYILEGTITDHRNGVVTDYGPGVGWPEDWNTIHWLENRGTIPAVEISVDIVRQE